MEDAIAAQVRTIRANRFTAKRGYAIGPGAEEFFPDVPVPADAPRIDQAAIDAADHAARQAIRPKPGRPPVSDEDKLAVLELYDTKSIPEIMEITGKKERTIRRWIADAKRLEAGGGGADGIGQEASRRQVAGPLARVPRWAGTGPALRAQGARAPSRQSDGERHRPRRVRRPEGRPGLARPGDDRVRRRPAVAT